MSRLMLEPLGVEHAPLLYDGCLDPRMYTYIPERPPVSLQEFTQEIRRLVAYAPPPDMDLALNWVIRGREDGWCIGTVQASGFVDGTLWVGYKVIPAAWGQGFGREAVGLLLEELRGRLGSREVLAAVDVRNLASIRLLEHLGFERLRTEAAEMLGQAGHDHIYRRMI